MNWFKRSNRTKERLEALEKEAQRFKCHIGEHEWHVGNGYYRGQKLVTVRCEHCYVAYKDPLA